MNNKSSVTPLEGDFSSVLAKIECSEYIYDYYTVCSGPEKHHNGETAAQGCTGTTKSQLVVIIGIKCNGGLPSQPGIDNPNSGESGSGEIEGGLGNNNPCSANGVYVNPQDPSSSSCNAGVVTQPILEFNPTPTPCEKLKNLLSPTKANIKPLITNGMYGYANKKSSTS